MRLFITWFSLGARILFSGFFVLALAELVDDVESPLTMAVFIF